MKSTTPINNWNPTQRRWFRRQLLSWGKQHGRDFPWRRTKDPYALLVAECLLQQTEASRVVPVYGQFLSQYPTIQDLASGSLPELSALWHPLGLHLRAARLSQLAGQILRDYGGKIPEREGELLKLPGVGRYIARSVCANAFDQPLAVLDTNVGRILERFFGLEGAQVKSRDKRLWEAAQQVAPLTQVSQWNLTLLDFGAMVCRAVNPHCQDCPLQQECQDWARHSISNQAEAKIEKNSVIAWLNSSKGKQSGSPLWKGVQWRYWGWLGK